MDLSLEHLEDTHTSTLLFHLTQRLLYTKWRDAGCPTVTRWASR